MRNRLRSETGLAAITRGVVVIVAALLTAGFLALVLQPWGPSSSEDKKFDVGRAKTQLLVQRDGSLDVTEQLRYRFSDHSFSGAFRDIALQPGVTLKRIGVRDGKLGDYEAGGNTQLGSRDRPGRFGVARLQDDGIRVVWHYSGQHGGWRDFEISYRALGVTKAYDDVVLVEWALWGDQWEFTLKELTGLLRLADPVRGDGRPLQTWVRPAKLRATADQKGAGTLVSAERIPSGTQVVVAAMYPRDAFAAQMVAADVESGNGRERVTTDQDERSSGAAGALAGWVWTNSIPIALVLLALTALAIARLVVRARELPASAPRHIPEPPEPASPVVAYGLAHEGRYDEAVVLAVLLDLVDRGHYTSAPGPADPDDPRDDQLDLVLSVPPEGQRPQSSELASYEKEVRSFFDDLIGDTPAPLSAMKDRIPKHSDTWRQRWASMNKELRAAAKSELEWDLDLRPQRAVIGVLAALAFVLLGIFCWVRARDLAVALPGMVLALAVVLVASGNALRRMAPATRERQARWESFARWTKDFPRLHDDPPATLALWKKILVFGVAFGTAKAVLDSGRIPAAVMQEAAGTWIATSGAGHYAFMDSGNFASSFGSGFSSQVAAQSSSGGSGGGGGSSGGGGGGAW